MKKEALIIFVRKPELGKVKTRLAAAIGHEAALEVYQKLLAHTQVVSAALSCDKYVFYAGAIEEDDAWSHGYQKRLQANGDLGEKMKAAFTHLFSSGYTHVCIIGSDCFELGAEMIQEAFILLESDEVVIGPARDGGYYLLGMKDGLKNVFEEIEWSTEKVLAQTTAKLGRHQHTYSLLPILTDVDTVDDLPKELLAELQQEKLEKKQ